MTLKTGKNGGILVNIDFRDRILRLQDFVQPKLLAGRFGVFLIIQS
jgi:hypothetical protein